jgi:ascorbate-specific PTS system EIIC-type component UlaA
VNPSNLTIICVVSFATTCALKITEVVDWSWWIVFAPVIGWVVLYTASLVIAFFVAFMMTYLVMLAQAEKRKKKADFEEDK